MILAVNFAPDWNGVNTKNDFGHPFSLFVLVLQLYGIFCRCFALCHTDMGKAFFSGSLGLWASVVFGLAGGYFCLFRSFSAVLGVLVVVILALSRPIRVFFTIYLPHLFAGTIRNDMRIADG